MRWLEMIEKLVLTTEGGDAERFCCSTQSKATACDVYTSGSEDYSLCCWVFNNCGSSSPMSNENLSVTVKKQCNVPCSPV